MKAAASTQISEMPITSTQGSDAYHAEVSEE